MLQIYCISLERKRHERFVKAFNMYFKPFNIDVIEWKAIDSNNYKNSIELADDNNFKLSTKLGEELNKTVVATAASHRSVWQEVVDKNLEAAVIMEDDVTIKSDFKEKLKEIWDIIKDDTNIDYVFLSFSSNPIVKTNEKKYNSHINQLENFNGLFCYLVKKSGAEKLLKTTQTLTYQIDIDVSKKINKHYCCKERLGYYNEEVISTIHYHRFKLFEYYLGLNFLNHKVSKPFEFYTPTIFTLTMISLGFLFKLYMFNYLIVHTLNLFVFIMELNIIGGRFDEFNIRIAGLIKNKEIGVYDSDEIANKLVDHLILSLTYFLSSYLLKFLFYLL